MFERSNPESKLPDQVLRLIGRNDQSWAHLQEWIKDVHPAEFASTVSTLNLIVGQSSRDEADHQAHHLRTCKGCMSDREFVVICYLANAAIGQIAAQHHENHGGSNDESHAASSE